VCIYTCIDIHIHKSTLESPYTAPLQSGALLWLGIRRCGNARGTRARRTGALCKGRLGAAGARAASRYVRAHARRWLLGYFCGSYLPMAVMFYSQPAVSVGALVAGAREVFRFYEVRTRHAECESELEVLCR